jgi:hypothetical protein
LALAYECGGLRLGGGHPHTAGTGTSHVEHPKHYNQHPSGIECIEVVGHMGFCLGNVIKYVWRADLKGRSIEDLKKARFYLDWEIKTREAALSAEGTGSPGDASQS